MKKKILFVHPLGVNWIPGETDMARVTNIMPPLGLCSLAAWVEKHGHQAALHDCYAFPGRDEKIFEVLSAEQPDFVGFSTTTSSFLDAVRLSLRIKEIYPKMRIIFGGVHISALRETLMEQYPVIDFGVVGEGELPLLALLEKEEGQSLRHIPGLLLRTGETILFTGFRSKDQLVTMDDLPFPAYNKLHDFPKAYKLPIFNYPKAPGTTIVSSRGCLYTCSYCDRTVFQRTFRSNSAQYLFDLILHLNETYGIKHINLYDDLFTLNRKRVTTFCDLMIAAKTGITFNCAARAEHIDLPLLQLMKKAGCWMMSLGIESGDPKLLSLHRSKSDLQMIREKLGLIKQAGIRTKGLFMLGLPGETEESMKKSIQYALDLPLDDINVAKFTPFPGSPLYKEIQSHGTFNEEWELMNCTNFVFIPKAISREQLEKRYMEFYRKHYERLPILLDYVTMLWRSPDSWIRFLWDLKSFLYMKNQYGKK